LESHRLALSDPARKRSSVLVFLSPWCESYFAKTRPQSSRECRAVREQLVALGRDRSVRWVGVASGLWASEQDLREYRDQHRIPVPLALDRDGAVYVTDAASYRVHRIAPAAAQPIASVAGPSPQDPLPFTAGRWPL
ncbi:hypothetical protein AB4084_29790, partial [Lysobacter sp. 2RAB21]